MRFIHKILAVGWVLVTYFSRGIAVLIGTREPLKRRKLLLQNLVIAAKGLLRALDISVKITNPDKLSLLAKRNHLIVTNHISYTDIIVLASLHPMLFITSKEMRNTPFLGQITQLGGSLYTDRRHISALKNDLQEITDVMKEGFDLALFPEGTSYNGEIVHPFRKSLFESAIQSATPVLPMCIKYLSIDHEPFSKVNRDKVCWYGDMAFFPHFPNMLKLKYIQVEITILDEIPIEEGMDRQKLSDMTFEVINSKFNQYPPLR